jgi:hypothetical protein
MNPKFLKPKKYKSDAEITIWWFLVFDGFEIVIWASQFLIGEKGNKN